MTKEKTITNPSAPGYFQKKALGAAVTMGMLGLPVVLKGAITWPSTDVITLVMATEEVRSAPDAAQLSPEDFSARVAEKQEALKKDPQRAILAFVKKDPSSWLELVSGGVLMILAGGILTSLIINGNLTRDAKGRIEMPHYDALPESQRRDVRDYIVGLSEQGLLFDKDKNLIRVTPDDDQFRELAEDIAKQPIMLNKVLELQRQKKDGISR